MISIHQTMTLCVAFTQVVTNVKGGTDAVSKRKRFKQKLRIIANTNPSATTYMEGTLRKATYDIPSEFFDDITFKVKAIVQDKSPSPPTPPMSGDSHTDSTVGPAHTALFRAILKHNPRLRDEKFTVFRIPKPVNGKYTAEKFSDPESVSEGDVLCLNFWKDLPQGFEELQILLTDSEARAQLGIKQSIYEAWLKRTITDYGDGYDLTVKEVLYHDNKYYGIEKESLIIGAYNILDHWEQELMDGDRSRRASYEHKTSVSRSQDKVAARMPKPKELSKSKKRRTSTGSGYESDVSMRSRGNSDASIRSRRGTISIADQKHRDLDRRALEDVREEGEDSYYSVSTDLDGSSTQS